MSLIKDVTRLIGELGGATCDTLTKHLPKATRKQILKALNNAASAKQIECIGRLPREGNRLELGIYVLPGSEPAGDFEAIKTRSDTMMIRDNALEVLRLIADRGPVVLRDIYTELGEDVRGHVIHLHRTKQFLETEKTRGDVVQYSVSDKGRRYLEGLDRPAGKMPEPRTGFSPEPFRPKPWNPPRGDASMQAYRLPSLHCGQQIERKRPAIIAGKALEPAVMRGGVQ